MVFWIYLLKQSPWDQEASASCPVTPSLPLCCSKTRVFFLFYFIVSKIERKDPGMLLLFCADIPRGRGWARPGLAAAGSSLPGKGEIGMDRSMPDVPTALGAGLMMVKSLHHACALCGSRPEESRSRSLTGSVHHLPGDLVALHHGAGFVFRELGNPAPGAYAFSDPSPCPHLFPHSLPAATLEPCAQEGAACATVSCPDGDGAHPFCHWKPGL